MKRALSLVLGLLVFFSLLTINTKTVKAESQYYVEIEGYTEETINSVLSTTTWEWYAPNYTVVGNVIYFDNYESFIRFLIPPTAGEDWLFPINVTHPSLKAVVLYMGVTDGNDADIKVIYTGSEPVSGRIFSKVSENYSPVEVYYSSDGLTEILFHQAGEEIRYKYGDVTLQNNGYVRLYIYGNGLYGHVYYVATGVDAEDFDTSQATAVADFQGKLLVTFNLEDALTGQSLSGVTVKENGTVLGTISDGESLQLMEGTHTLTFEKSGYWSVTKTIDVQSDMSVTVEMYPDDYVMMVSSQVSDVYQYSQGVATLQVSVVEGSGYGYSTKVSISGVEVTKVTWDGGVINKGDDGSYYLGDISSGELKIYFKAGDALGQRSFRVTFTTYDALANAKVNEYTITYEVKEPPFRVVLPVWKVGVNTVRVTDQSGVDRVISVILYDAQGTEVYSDSQSLLSYGSVEFNIPIDSLDSYLLEVRSNDGISLYFDVTASVPIVLQSDTITVSGDTGEVVVEVSNSGNSVAYYKFVVEGTPIDNSTQPVEVSLAPGETKTVTVPFKLKSDLTLDTYEATIKALDANDAEVWSSTFIIKRSSGFSLPVSLGSSEDYLGLGALALLGILGVVALARRGGRGE